MSAPGRSGVDFRPADPTVPPASALLAAMEAEMLALYAPGGAAGPGGAVGATGGRIHIGVPLEFAELAPPGGVYLVGRVDGEVVAGGGVRTIGTGVGEVKRMYVVPARRGRGFGPALLAALEAHAAGVLGLGVARLDTGPKQPGAQRLYERAGYRRIGNYNGNAHAAFWGEKRLAG